MRAAVILVVAVAMVVGGLAPAAAAAVDARAAGRWTDPFWEGGDAAYEPSSLDKSKKFPTAVTAVALPDGRLLYWNGWEGSEKAEFLVFDEETGLVVENSRSRLLDLRSGSARWTIPKLERGTTSEAQDESDSATHDLFCAGQSLLYDGTVLIAGGSEWIDRRDDPGHELESDLWGDLQTRIFDPRTDSFRNVTRMREERWYPSLVTLPDGRVAAMTGTRRVILSFLNPEPSFSQVRRTEIYDPSTERWEDGGEGDFSLPLLARLHLLPDGMVFYGGTGEYWTPFGQTADQATWALQRVYDPEAKTWSFVGETAYGGRNGAASTLLRLDPPYDEAKVLLAGGTIGPAPGTWVATTLSTIVRWTPEGISNESVPPAPFAGLTGDETQLRQRRWMGNSLLLPTGEVFLVNGGDGDDVIDPGSAEAVLTPELYDPESGTWSKLAPSKRERVYHASAALLPDGRVLVGGHAPLNAHYYRHDHPVTRNSNYRDSTFEIYEPPYLFRGPRPVVANVAPTQQGRALKLSLGRGTSPGDVSEVVLVRLSANTHALDSDLRAVKLGHRVSGRNVVADLPHGGDGRVLPPGPYYVFAMRDTKDGPVPSVAKVVLIQPQEDGRVVARALRAKAR